MSLSLDALFLWLDGVAVAAAVALGIGTRTADENPEAAEAAVAAGYMK